MARGWESKSIEEQQALSEGTIRVPDKGNRDNSNFAARARQKQELELQREQILSQRTSSPIRRAALKSALAEIEGRLASLDREEQRSPE